MYRKAKRELPAGLEPVPIKQPPSQRQQQQTRKAIEKSNRAIEKLCNECKRLNISGIRGLGILFRGLDSDYSQTLTYNEIRDGLARYGINISKEDLKLIFQRMDDDGSGAVDFKEFITKLTPAMAACRLDVVNEAFDKLDHNGDGVLRIEDLMVTYKAHAQNHPRFRSNEWTMEQVLASFLDAFDSPTDKDGCVTRDEFIQYYAGVSCMIDDDSYFDLTMRKCWGLPMKQTISRANTVDSIQCKVQNIKLD